MLVSHRRISRVSRLFGAALLVALPVAAACGSRTSPLNDDVPDSAAPAVACHADLDCAKFGDLCSPVICNPFGRCEDAPQVDCDDHDVCTTDSCDGKTGACAHLSRTPDNDKDGHHAPLPGHRPADSGACGDDCDDTNGAAFPGNSEICDGVDNDCNGVVDDGQRYVPLDPSIDAVRVSGEIAPADTGDLAWGTTGYLAGYTGEPSGKIHFYTSVLDAAGTKTVPEATLSKATADSVGGVVGWTGSEFGLSWSDRRDSWETYFVLVDEKGNKLGPDTLISDEDGEWSLNTSLVWTGFEWIVGWQDMRDIGPDFTLYARRVDAKGKPVAAAVALDDDQGENVALAVGLGSIGATWVHTEGKSHSIWFRSFDRNLKPLGPKLELTKLPNGGQNPTIVWNRDSYAIAWDDRDGALHAVYGALVGEKGELVVPTHALTESPKFSRYPSLRPLGDRFLLVWSDTKDGNLGYELYSKMLDQKLGPLDVERRITHAQGDSIGPATAFGPKGDVGIIFRDDRTKASHIYFTRLVCAAGPG